MIGSRNGLSTYQAWYWNDTILTRNTPGYYCNGICEGKAPGAGITYNCSSTTVPLDLANSSGVIFAINLTMREDSTGEPFLLLTTLYSSAVNDSCVATLSVDTCDISAATVEYPITITNTTVTLNTNGFQSMDVVSTFVSDGDLPTAPEGTGAGPLQGFYDAYGYYLNANVTVQREQYYSGGSELADLFFEPQPVSYSNFTFAHCGLQWSSPTEYALNSLNNFMFRSALSAANGTEVQIFTVQRTSPALVFRSDYRYLVAALVFILVALLAVLNLLWGWWELGRRVSLSPIEIAKAFKARITDTVSDEFAVDGILKGIGETAVRYERGSGEMVGDDEELRHPRAKAPVLGEVSGPAAKELGNSMPNSPRRPSSSF